MRHSDKDAVKAVLGFPYKENILECVTVNQMNRDREGKIRVFVDNSKTPEERQIEMEILLGMRTDNRDYRD